MSVAVKTVTRLHSKSGLVKDDIALELCFAPAAFNSTTVADIGLDIEAFFSDLAPGQVNLLGSYLGQRVSRTVPPTIDVWDLTGHLDGSPLGSPDASHTFVANLPAAAITGDPDLPPQAALRVSIHGNLTGLLEEGPPQSAPTTHAARHEGAPATFNPISRPKARRRGGFYFGPLTRANTTRLNASTGETYAQANLISDLAVAFAHQFMDGLNVPVVWSRREADVFPVVGVKVADAFTIQRKRANRASTFVTRP